MIFITPATVVVLHSPTPSIVIIFLKGEGNTSSMAEMMTRNLIFDISKSLSIECNLKNFSFKNVCHYPNTQI